MFRGGRDVVIRQHAEASKVFETLALSTAGAGRVRVCRLIAAAVKWTWSLEPENSVHPMRTAGSQATALVGIQ